LMSITTRTSLYIGFKNPFFDLFQGYAQ